MRVQEKVVPRREHSLHRSLSVAQARVHFATADGMRVEDEAILLREHSLH